MTVGRNWSHPAKRESMERRDMSMTTVWRASSRRFMTLGPGRRVHTADTRGREANDRRIHLATMTTFYAMARCFLELAVVF